MLWTLVKKAFIVSLLTELSALNAAIEIASSGDQGRAFAALKSIYIFVAAELKKQMLLLPSRARLFTFRGT